MRLMSWIRLSIALALVIATGCTGGTKTTNGTTSDCDAQRTHVESLYRAELANGRDATGQAARAQEVADNVDMVLRDCQTAAQRFAPCLQAAVSVAQMERDCLIPLDDQGTVEGRAFGQRGNSAQ